MKIFAVITKSTAAAAAVCLLAGCMRFEYSGRAFSPDESSVIVKCFEDRKKMPAGKYIIIGRGTLITARNTEKEDIIIRLQDEAADRGADAVCIISIQEKKIGMFESYEEYSDQNNDKAAPCDLTPDGASEKKKVLGKPTSIPSGYRATIRLVVKALFLKDKNRLEKIISGRNDQLDQIIKRQKTLSEADKAGKK